MTAPNRPEPFPAGKQSAEPVSVADQFTPADVDLVERAQDRHRVAFYDGMIAECVCGSREDDHETKVILAALAGAGRLLPPDGTSRIEWAVRVDEPHPARKEKRGAFITRLAPENARHAPKIWAGWTTVRREIQTWPGGWRRVGPWLPVPTTPETP